MGANLNRLMQSYGVYTPTMSPYTGVDTPDALKAGATAGERGTYQGSLADYAAQQDAFKGYERDYRNRIATTDLYTNPGPASTFLSTPNYSGIKGMRANLSDTTSADTTDYTNPNFDSMINDAYRSLGRVGIGTDTSNIDQAGYDYWKGRLQAGANGGIAPGDFKNQFKTSTNDYIRQYPDDDYTKYIQGYLGILPATTLPVLPTPGGDTTPGPGGDTGMGGEGPGSPGGSSDYGGGGSGLVGPTGNEQVGLDANQAANNQNASASATAEIADQESAQDSAASGYMARGGPVNSPTSMEEALLNDRSRHEFSDPRFEELYGKYFYDRGGIANLGNLPVVEPPIDNTTTATTVGSSYGSSEGGSDGSSEGGSDSDITTIRSAAPTPQSVDPREDLFNKYFQRQPESAAVIAARKNVDDNRAALLKTIQDQSGKSEENLPSKAEMYFRLAAAAFAPTKTGKGAAWEAIGNLSKEVGEFEKSTTDSKRASAAKKLQMMLETNKITLQAATEGLADLQNKDAQDNANRKAFGLKIFDVEQEKNKPITDAQKRAISLGYRPGTPEYTNYIAQQESARVKKETDAAATAEAIRNKPESQIGRELVDAGFIPGSDEYKAEFSRLVRLREEKANAIKPSTPIGQRLVDAGFTPGSPEFQAEFNRLTTLEDDKAKVAAEVARIAAAAAKQKLTTLTPFELKLRTETEDAVGKVDQSLADLKRAYAINDLTYKGAWGPRVQMFIKEGLGSDDPIVINTREQMNLLSSQALGSLKELFPGAISDGERKALLALQGIGSSSLEERKKIIMRAYEALKSSAARNRARIERIDAGKFRQININPNPEGESSSGE